MAINSKLCLTFTRLSERTWTDLEDAHRFNFSLGEETITDNILLELLRHCSQDLKIYKYDKITESHTGADWIWWFISQRKCFGIITQAKKLYSKSLKYETLDKKSNNPGPFQADNLIKTANQLSVYPMYCFYNYWPNHKPMKRLPIWNCNGFPNIKEWFGCSIADAYVIRDYINQRPRIKSLKRIGDISWPWMCLVCCYCGSIRSTWHLSTRARKMAEKMREKAKNINKIPNIPLPTSKSKLPRYVKDMIKEHITEKTFKEIDEFDSIAGVVVLLEIRRKKKGAPVSNNFLGDEL